MAYEFTAKATGEADDDIIIALELMIKQIQDGYTSGFDRGENRDFSWSMAEGNQPTIMALNYPVPDIDDYIAIRVPLNSGCEGCVSHRNQFRCSAIPCIPRVSRPWPVIYKAKP